MSAVDGDAGAVRRRQLVLFSVIAAVVLVVLAVWLTAGGGGQPAVQGGIEAELAGPDIAEKVWTRRSEARIGTIETRLREMETEARRLGSENERLRQNLAGDAANARSVIDRQAAVIDALERQMNAPPPAETPDGTGFFRPAESQAGTPAANPAPAPPAPLIETFELKDAGNGGTGPGAAGPGIGGLSGAAVKPVGRWLPAGAHAEAIVLSGVDASAGVSSQGDPRPVLFRITGPAWTAAENGAAMQVDVAGCTVTGAAHGDLSSEKIYARLRTMTCAGPGSGTVIETDVAGFVAGSGKVGVRGPVVSREGALVEKAFLAGMVSGRGPGRVAGVPAAGRRHRRRRGGRQYRSRRYRPRRARLGRGERRAEGCRLHDPPRRTVPAGDPARGRDPGDAGVPRRRAPRRPGGREIGSQEQSGRKLRCFEMRF